MILVTGAAGFIGFHVSRALLARGDHVVGLDNLNDYYDPSLKKARLALLDQERHFSFEECDISDRERLLQVWRSHPFEGVIHLAAQAGVRYSIINPHAYVQANLAGFLNVLELLRSRPPRHAVYASSSSVYGANRKQPFSENDRVDLPVSLYAATKRADELLAHVYAASYAIPITGLRFFTVYGPWGRPDMAPMKFARSIVAGERIDVYNHGNMSRDFTYVDDVADAVVRVLDRVPAADESGIPHRLFNVGNNRPEPLLRFIEVLGMALGRKPELNLLPMQLGDVAETWADVSAIRAEFDWEPRTSIDVGLRAFADWYRDQYARSSRPVD